MKIFATFIVLCGTSLFLAGCLHMSDDAPSRPSPSKPFYKVKNPQQCVPYAREESGIEMYGDAHTWWNQARANNQSCGVVPQVGSVMVLAKTSRLKYGHVAVVKKIVDSRTIEVSHSNWGGDKRTRSIVYERMPVKDVSANNDWSSARFWHYPSKSFGSPYPVSGFVYADVEEEKKEK